MPRNRAFTVIVAPTGAPIPVRSCDWAASVNGEEETTTCTGETPWGVLRSLACDMEMASDPEPPLDLVTLQWMLRRLAVKIYNLQGAGVFVGPLRDLERDVLDEIRKAKA